MFAFKSGYFLNYFLVPEATEYYVCHERKHNGMITERGHVKC